VSNRNGPRRCRRCIASFFVHILGTADCRHWRGAAAAGIGWSASSVRFVITAGFRLSAIHCVFFDSVINKTRMHTCINCLLLCENNSPATAEMVDYVVARNKIFLWANAFTMVVVFLSAVRSGSHLTESIRSP